MGKGSARRPSLVSRELEELRWKLAMERISFATYEKKYRELKKVERKR